MENNDILAYQQPATRVIILDFDKVFCFSGNHEGTSEEDWDEP